MSESFTPTPESRAPLNGRATLSLLNDQQLLDLLATDISAMVGENLVLSIDAQTLLSLVGNLQLALRHPDNHGHPATAARGLIEAARAHFAGHGAKAILEAIRRGVEPEATP